MIDFSSVPAVAKAKAPTGELVYGIADGETVARLWNPDFAHGTLASCRKAVDAGFPCVHRVCIVDPETHLPVFGRKVWFIAPEKKSFARYAKDYTKQTMDEGIDTVIAKPTDHQ